MPFTFIHPAAIIPFTALPQRWISITGLAVGSVVPDFEYFLRMRYESDHGHTVAGLFYFDLPLGVLLSFAFHGLVRNALVNNLPLALRSRLWPYTTFQWGRHFRARWGVVMVSILLGAATHMVWDTLGHSSGPVPGLLPGAENTVLQFGRHMSKLHLLEHTSNVLGAALLLAWLLSRPRTSTVMAQGSRSYWWIFALLSVLTLYVRFLGVDLTPKWINHVVVSGISAMLLALCLTPVVLALFGRRYPAA